MNLQNFTFASITRNRANILRQALALGALAACGTAHADERGSALLQRSQEILRQAKSLTAEFTTESVYASRYRDTKEQGTVALSRSGQVRIEITRFRKPEDADRWIGTGNGSTVVADGSTLWTLIRHPQSAQVRSIPQEAAGPGAALAGIEPLRSFFGGADTPPDDVSYAGKRNWENADYEVVTVKQPAGSRAGENGGEAELYIGSDGLIHRFLIHPHRGDGTSSRTASLRHIKLNEPLAASLFAFTPSPDSVPFEAARGNVPLAAGTTAPDFAVEDSAGNAVHLADFRGKVVVLKFWATWCWSCKQSLPQTDAIARRYGDKDVVVLAVDIWDSRKAFHSWLAARPATDAIRFAIDTKPQGKDTATALYHVRATPTQFVIGKDGRIVSVVEGFDGPSDQLEKALAAAGISPAERAGSE